MAMEKTQMKGSDALLAVLVILPLAFVFWVFYAGEFDAKAGSFIDQIWNSIQGMLRPLFRR
jgi:hypothetical protein